jgi:hypothetical protein
MPLLELNRAQITRARAALAEQRNAQRDSSARHAMAKAELNAMRRRGAGRDELARQQQQINELAGSARRAHEATRGAIGAIKDLSEALLERRDPALMVEALSTQHPVALMPVAIQTRYDDATTRLMIRIYPDTLHGYGHEPGLTPKEIDAGKRYWTQRFAVPGDADSPWTEIARVYGPMRAAYVVRTLTPTNMPPSAQNAQPAFDDASIPLADKVSQQSMAVALPDRFVAVGFNNGVEIFRKWGTVVADMLPLSPLLDPLLTEEGASADPFAGDRAWMVDYAEAEKAGMAITVTPRDLMSGARLTHGVQRLVVLGVDWTQTPESAAQLVASLLDNHHHNDGLAFTAQGTPTNNTAVARAGFASNGADLVAALDPAQADAQAAAVADELASAGARLQLLLGLPKATFDVGLVPGADLMEGATAGHMVNALWNATIGYTLRYFWNPLDAASSLIDDDAIEQLRAFCVRFLRPGGPLSAIRVGKQPYGILPVVARGFVPQANSAIERELHEALSWFRLHWQRATRTVPTLQNPSAESLHQVLAMQPWSVAKRFWQVAGPAAIANYPDIKDHSFAQSLLIRMLVEGLLDRQPFSTKAPFIASCAVRPKPHSLDAVPWIQRDPAHPQRELDGPVPLARDYIAALLSLLSQPSNSWRAALGEMQNAESLLEAMLAFAADEELLHGGRRLFYDHLQSSPLVSADVKLRAKNMRWAEYTGVDVQTQVGDQFDVGHANAILGLQLVGTTGERSVESHIGQFFGEVAVNWPERLKNIADFRESLRFLQQRHCGELNLALRTTLDLCSHRLDAWITSLATRRLDQMRESQPEGLHIGAWGVVENLLPDSVRPVDQAADSLGYVHAPSLQQATTAAILRSGHVANRQAAGSAFNIDLRSHRVRHAKRLLEGIANGQQMAALLGYRFERALRDAKPDTLAMHILDYRRAFPLRPAGPAPGDQAQEAVAARDVIDGVRLIAEYRSKGIAAISPATVPASAHARIAGFIDDLLDQMDAVSDLLIAESVHQIAGGNMDGGGAAMMALDKQARPPEPRVVDTAHRTRGYTQRVVVAMQTENAGAWADVGDLAAQIEPRLNAWLARMIGDPSRFRFEARVLDRQADQQHPAKFVWIDSGQTLEVGLEELQMSPLSLVLGSEAQQGGGQSAFQEALGLRFGAKARDQFGDAADTKAIVLQLEAPAMNGGGGGGAGGGGEGGGGAGADTTLGLVAFESFAWLLRRLLDKSRPLRRMDMVLAEDGVETQATLDDGEFAGVDLDDLEARLKMADDHAAEVLEALADAVTAAPDDDEALAALDPDAPATQALLADVQAALTQAYTLGWRSALAREPVPAPQGTGAPQGGDTTPDAGESVAPRDTAYAAVHRARALHAEVSARLDAAPLADGTEMFARQVGMALERIRAILGKSFPVLPRFTLGGYAAAAQASLEERDMLLGKADLGNDDHAIAGWLPKLGCVHEATGFLSDVITACEAMGGEGASRDFKLLQYPRDPELKTQHWGALPPAEEQDLRGTVAVVAWAPNALDGIAGDDTLAGLFIDEWSESIPSTKETTGISFHFDAPGARAPQSVLLAVPADTGEPNWTLDALLATVDEALALSRLRAVRPQDLKGLGLLLPGIFLSTNYQRDVPSLDFASLVTKNLSVLRTAAGATSANAVMKMAAGKTFLSE